MGLGCRPGGGTAKMRGASRGGRSRRAALFPRRGPIAAGRGRPVPRRGREPVRPPGRRAVGVRPLPAERRRAREALAERSRYPASRRARPAPRLAVRRRRSSARGSSTATCTRYSTPTTRRTRCTASSPPSALLRERGRPQPLVITTNYDDLVERAFDERRRGLRRRLVRGEARRQMQGVPAPAPGGEVVRSSGPNKYTGLRSASGRDPEAARRVDRAGLDGTAT